DRIFVHRAIASTISLQRSQVDIKKPVRGSYLRLSLKPILVAHIMQKVLRKGRLMNSEIGDWLNGIQK
ncbi:hypothetical protein MMC31_004689, partial [Peltigera leucophlebia]|nr:hypothetical protein [Peltigera leucophlebia]